MTTIPIVDQVAELAERIRKGVSGSDVDFTSFPSGAAMLDVRCGGRLFVMSYTPASGFGVDEVHDGEGFQLGYRFASPDFESSAQQLWTLLTGAAAA